MVIRDGWKITEVPKLGEFMQTDFSLYSKSYSMVSDVSLLLFRKTNSVTNKQSF